MAGKPLSVPLPGFAPELRRERQNRLMGLALLTPAILLASTLYLTVTLCPFVFRVWRRLDESVGESSGDHVGGAVA